MEIKIDLEKLAAWLEKHWKGEKKCPICQTNNWSINEKLFSIDSVFKDASKNAKVFQFVAILQCLTCGNTILINPFIGDLSKKEEDSPTLSIKPPKIG